MEEAEARRARLKALRAEAAEAAEPEAAGNGAAGAEAAGEPRLAFRNYVPEEEALLHRRVPAARAPEELGGDAPQAKDLDVAGGTAEETLANVQPKKPHWDLQRDVQGRLDKLERRTQRAIVELMQAEERAKLAP